MQSIPTQFERVVVLRFKYEPSCSSGLEQAVKQNKIRNGVILNGFGSVRNYQVHQVSNRTLPSKNMFVKDPSAPADIAAMSGFVLNGRCTRTLRWRVPTRRSAATWSPARTSSPSRS